VLRIRRLLGDVAVGSERRRGEGLRVNLMARGCGSMMDLRVGDGIINTVPSQDEV
jgi:hypothetical protein